MKKTLNRNELAACAIMALGAAGLGLGGCAAPLERASARQGGAGAQTWQEWDGGAGTWSLVMNSPRTQLEMGGADMTSLPEYGRKDDAMGYRQDGPVLASNEWPERERPDLFYARRLQLETRADQVLWFDTGSRYYGGYGGYRSGYGSGYYGGGTWGFWR